MTRHINSRTSSPFSISTLKRCLKRPVAVVIFLAVASVAVFASVSFVTKWGTTGQLDGQFLTPTAITVDGSGNVYVTEGGQRVQKFNNNGVFQLKFGSGGSSPGQFISPNGIAVDSAGNIYVSDNNDPTHSISKFTPLGVFVTYVGSGFVGPGGVAVDSGDNLYVLDANGQRVRKYDSTGAHVLDFGTGVAGSADGQFNFPQGIAVDASNNVYVADTGNNRIQKFTSGGVFITKWGSAGTIDGQFMSPLGVSAALGYVYVADNGNSRVQRFSDAGAFVESFGTAGSGDGEFSGPQDVAADSLGNIFVADSGNDRIQKFSTTAAPVVANAGPDQTVECNGATTSVTLDGTASTGSGTLSYTWKEGTTTLGTGATLNTSLPTGTHTITLSVSSSAGGSDDDEVIITIVDTLAPTLTLNGANPMTVECHDGFSDPGATASDACAGDLTSSIVVTGSVNPNVVGPYTLTYTVSDGSHTTTKNRTVNVVDTTKPVIVVNGPNPMTVECHTSFTDPGATANDSCQGSFAATASGSVNVNVPGPYTITYNASDASGNAATPMTRTVIVVDTTLPVITLNGNAPALWPPNHKYQTFSVTDFVIAATDSCNTSLGVANVVISQVTSDELENSGGDGNTLNDIVIAADCKSVQLRAERDGGGDGRVYKITFKVTDSSGNVGTATAIVVVPKSQSSGPAIDSGPHYTVNGTCP
jgi:tripartite motif-containing protein 71